MRAPPMWSHTPDQERRIRDAALDRTLAGTFPASDPLSSNPNPYDPAAVEQDVPTVGDWRAVP